MRPLLLITICMALVACAKFPELDAAVSDRAKASDYPQLVPAQNIAVKRDGPKRLAKGDGEALLARANRLRQRGAILRGLLVVDEAARLRFSAALRRLGG